jgi:peptidoglycan-N-acetylglucosamine deacetylase
VLGRSWGAIGLLTFACAVGQAAPQPLAFSRVGTDKPWVALTFDCCQTRKVTGFDAALVRWLMDHKVPATFFLGGRWIESHPEAVKTLAGTTFFELGNHSYLHPHFPQLTAAQMREELTRTQALLQKASGKQARFFRPPYGEWNALTLREATTVGLALVTWTVATGDPDPKASVHDLVAAADHAQRGAIIIMHANGRGWKTAQALPTIVQHLRRRGLEPVTLGKLLASGQPGLIAPK